MGGNLRFGKGFKVQTGEVWASHNGRGLYSGEDNTVRTVRTYEVAFDIPDGLGGVVSQHQARLEARPKSGVAQRRPRPRAGGEPGQKRGDHRRPRRQSSRRA